MGKQTNERHTEQYRRIVITNVTAALTKMRITTIITTVTMMITAMMMTMTMVMMMMMIMMVMIRLTFLVTQ